MTTTAPYPEGEPCGVEGVAPPARHCAQAKGRVQTFARLYALSAVSLAAATASSALRHAPWPWTVLYTALMVLTVLGAYAWNTALGQSPGASTTADADARGGDTSSNTPPS
ncbi:hypothetical protein [Streptomyces botrytidirepellens]|uniref:hypothetical protein n=1 Tax=Streptomyces botrytidirepellens TaxID=2486417 RepID=UPI0011CD9980|nr:hypothetical protein [Streptomyces botrytidirepellens]